MKKKCDLRVIVILAVCLLLVAGFAISHFVSMSRGSHGGMEHPMAQPGEYYYYANEVYVRPALPVRISNIHLPPDNETMVCYVKGLGGPDRANWVNGVDMTFGNLTEDEFAPRLPYFTQQFSHGESDGRGEMDSTFTLILRSDSFYEPGTVIPVTVDYYILGVIPGSAELLLEI